MKKALIMVALLLLGLGSSLQLLADNHCNNKTIWIKNDTNAPVTFLMSFDGGSTIPAGANTPVTLGSGQEITATLPQFPENGSQLNYTLQATPTAPNSPTCIYYGDFTSSLTQCDNHKQSSSNNSCLCPNFYFNVGSAMQTDVSVQIQSWNPKCN